MYEWIDDCLSNGDMAIDQVFETGYYVPFIPALEHFLNVKSVYKEVKRSFRRNSLNSTQVYSDVWDGARVKENPIYLRHNGKVLGNKIKP